jgi:hypothetical protein
LLRRAEGVFDVFLTADQQLKYQQNLKGRKLAILILSTNRWPRVKGKIPEIISAIQSLQPGDYLELVLWHIEAKAESGGRKMAGCVLTSFAKIFEVVAN